jgi:hypothetical protein
MNTTSGRKAMNRSSSATPFCSIERTRSRTRIAIRHDPAFALGLIAHRRKGRGVTRRLAGHICRRIEEARPPASHARESAVRRWFSAARSLHRVWGVLPALLRA